MLPWALSRSACCCSQRFANVPNYSLLFARTLDHAVSSAAGWKWDGSNELRNEFRRPDTGERARFVPDVPSALNDLRWNTRVYLGGDWEKRRDAERLVDLIESGFFKLVDPELPPPRPRAPRDRTLNDIRKQLEALSERRR